ncbi:MAG: zinc-dependent alcohol dehydrogenase family protein [Elusimicrobiota bacterium]
MMALTYQGPGRKSWEARPVPKLRAPTDAVVKILATTICGTDLHILKGDVPEVTPGRILGHEGVGTVTEVGAAVTAVKPGDTVLISCISSCAICPSCREGMYSHCERGGGWVLGHLIDGTQAEYVRIPFADTSLYPLAAGADAGASAMLSDIFPTALECGVLNGRVKPGDVVAVVGAGPIGLACVLTAQFYGPAEIIAIDRDDHRLAAAKKFGATRTINPAREDAVKRVTELTGGRGADAVIEAVGVPETFELCQELVAAGGVIANIGVHGKSATLHLEKLWARNIAITTRLVDTAATPMLLKAVRSGKLDPARLVTHRFPLGEILKAYDVFSDAAKSKALKVVLTA